MRICVTGGAGFIGHHTVRALIEADHDVLVIDNLSTGRRDHMPAQAVLVVADILDKKAVESALRDFNPDGVLHLAARVTIRGSVEDFAEDARQNFVGSACVLEAAVKAGVSRFVLASSMAVYDDAPGPRAIPEDWPKNPLSPYGISKLAAERLTHLMGRQSGVSTMVLRLFNTFGTGQQLTPYVGVITIFISRILAGRPVTIFGDGEQCRDFVYVGDVARACVLAMESSVSGETVNIGTGKGTTVNEVSRLLHQRLGSSLKPEYAPGRSEELRNSVADIRRAGSLLGYAPGATLADKIDEVTEAARAEAAGGTVGG